MTVLARLDHIPAWTKLLPLAKRRDCATVTKDNATNADLFDSLPEQLGYDDMPWHLQRFVRSICDMRPPLRWPYNLPFMKDDDDE